ncbi:ISSag7, transposase OrfA family protein [Aneurinibacillus aneurinilyticus ATCC 12856]|jgi:transposase-like protein|uniref:ISSag7, transposase OrfA family protein n=1 Tax=Aneurinibacillus aneurinilyticus ATCC 12856 TaxID=649747 RepID=U1YC89_ANEAE|nr:ISSag7, transposase OrfA family protein [Aneurinibacillus aneurinilyticus ATCC 12856]
MGTRVSYPAEVKVKAVKMRIAGVPVKEVLRQLNIRNYTQLKTWMKWYKNGEMHRFEQPVGKQYSYGKGPKYETEMERVQAENRYLRQQIEVLKKYKELERKWYQK